MKNPWIVCFIFLCLTVFLISPIAYSICYSLSENHSGELLSSLLEYYKQVKRNPFIVSSLAIIPFLLLFLCVFIFKKKSCSKSAQLMLAYVGSASIICLMFWGNLTYWPNFLPDVPYPGFPHGLELVIIPVFFAPVAVVVVALLLFLVRKQFER